MWRFLLPAVTTMAALVVLFASALGDVRTLPHLPGQILAVIKGDAGPGRQRDQQKLADAALATPSPAVAQEQATLEGLQRQVAELQRQSAELQEQVTQRSQELEQRTREAAAASADADKLQTSVAALRQQHASLTTRQKQAVATARAAAPRSAASAMQAAPAASAQQQLLTARQWLAAGRPDEARRVLAMVQTQMVLQPVTPDRPAADGGNASAGDVGKAIRWLDIGANGQALQAIDHAVAGARGAAAREQSWPAYSGAPRGAYGVPDWQGNDLNNGTR